jgi:hypothetical protein
MTQIVPWGLPLPGRRKNERGTPQLNRRRAAEPFFVLALHLHNHSVLHDDSDAAEAQAAQGIEDRLNRRRVIVGSSIRRIGQGVSSMACILYAASFGANLTACCSTAWRIACQSDNSRSRNEPRKPQLRTAR